jgi:hypothetical protein
LTNFWFLDAENKIKKGERNAKRGIGQIDPKLNLVPGLKKGEGEGIPWYKLGNFFICCIVHFHNII